MTENYCKLNWNVNAIPSDKVTHVTGSTASCKFKDSENVNNESE